MAIQYLAEVDKVQLRMTPAGPTLQVIVGSTCYQLVENYQGGFYWAAHPASAKDPNPPLEKLMRWVTTYICLKETLVGP